MQKIIVAYKFPSPEEVEAIAEGIKVEMAYQPLTENTVTECASRIRDKVLEALVIEVSTEALK